MAVSVNRQRRGKRRRHCRPAACSLASLAARHSRQGRPLLRGRKGPRNWNAKPFGENHFRSLQGVSKTQPIQRVFPNLAALTITDELARGTRQATVLACSSRRTGSADLTPDENPHGPWASIDPSLPAAGSPAHAKHQPRVPPGSTPSPERLSPSHSLSAWVAASAEARPHVQAKETLLK